MVPLNEQYFSMNIDERSSFTIEQVAELGLLPPTDRTEGNYRRYSEADIQRLEHIKKLRDLLGFSLADIREILNAEDERGQIKVAYQHETEAATKIAQLDRADELIRNQLHLIQLKLDGLEQMRAGLLASIERHQRRREELLNNN
jgi:DNA-binding transcriptional MerR regulator